LLAALVGGAAVAVVAEQMLGAHQCLVALAVILILTGLNPEVVVGVLDQLV
jgi:hypothetical protein